MSSTGLPQGDSGSANRLETAAAPIVCPRNWRLFIGPPLRRDYITPYRVSTLERTHKPSANCRRNREKITNERLIRLRVTDLLRGSLTHAVNPCTGTEIRS